MSVATCILYSCTYGSLSRIDAAGTVLGVAFLAVCRVPGQPVQSPSELLPASMCQFAGHPLLTDEWGGNSSYN